MAANMDGGSEQRTVEEILLDFKGRRAGIIKALDTDFEDFYKKCDPEGKILCLYGLPNEQWEVKMPEKDKPPEIPDPVIGINLLRDEMEKHDWIAFLAVNSDSWLLSVAFFLGARLDKTERKRLFDMINDLPTIFDVLFAKELKRLEMWTSLANPASHSEDFRHRICAACEEQYAKIEFWICCDECKQWFHGECVDITSEKAEKMKRYYCPPCNLERSLQ